MRDASAAYPKSARLIREAWTPRIVSDMRLHIGILVAVVLAVALYIFLQVLSPPFALRANLARSADLWQRVSVECSVLSTYPPALSTHRKGAALENISVA